MRARTAWLIASPVIAVLCAAVVAGCPEAPSPPPMTQGVTPEEHDPFFPIGPTDNHALERSGGVGQDAFSCASCHTGTATFAEFTCLNCHAATTAVENALDAKHASARGYLKADASCYACHPRGSAAFVPAEGEGEGEPFDHNADAFPLPHGNNVGCADCHPGMFDTPPEYSTRCAGCHLSAENQAATNSGHALLADYYDGNNNETGCRECHATTPIDPAVRPFSNHNAVSGPSGGFGTSHFQPASCKVCHTSVQDPPKEWAIDFLESTCTAACHGAGEPHGQGCSPGNQAGC